jgi:hypothetical protein
MSFRWCVSRWLVLRQRELESKIYIYTKTITKDWNFIKIFFGPFNFWAQLYSVKNDNTPNLRSSIFGRLQSFRPFLSTSWTSALRIFRGHFCRDWDDWPKKTWTIFQKAECSTRPKCIIIPKIKRPNITQSAQIYFSRISFEWAVSVVWFSAL